MRTSRSTTPRTAGSTAFAPRSEPRAWTWSFDGAGGRIGSEAFELTGRGARFLSCGAASGGFPSVDAEAEQRGVRVIGIHDRPSARELRRHTAAALALLATGEIRPLIGQVLPLERASEAHAAIEDRSVPGKTLPVTGSRAKEAP